MACGMAQYLHVSATTFHTPVDRNGARLGPPCLHVVSPTVAVSLEIQTNTPEAQTIVAEVVVVLA